jgi:hypothetical protein
MLTSFRYKQEFYQRYINDNINVLFITITVYFRALKEESSPISLILLCLHRKHSLHRKHP